MFSIWINRILSSLNGYSVHNTDFFGLSKGLTYIHLELISKVFIILFLLCLWGKGSKCHVYSLLGQTEGKKKPFFKRGREGLYRVRLPHILLSFLWDYKSFSFCEIWIIPPPRCFLELLTAPYVFCR